MLRSHSTLKFEPRDFLEEVLDKDLFNEDFTSEVSEYGSRGSGDGRSVSDFVGNIPSAFFLRFFALLVDLTLFFIFFILFFIFLDIVDLLFLFLYLVSPSSLNARRLSPKFN